MLRRFLAGAAILVLISATYAAELRPRLAVLTDIGGDPDDRQSLIRLMVYANEFEIEALIASAAGTRGELAESVTRPDLIREIIAAYGQVLPALRRRADGWPTAEALHAVVRSGNRLRGRSHIGAAHDTEGSRLLVERLDRNVLNTGALGALYPTKTWTAPNSHSCQKEGDTPSWFFFLPRSGNDPANPGRPGWGGQFRQEPDGWWRDLPATAEFDPRTTVSRWRPDFQADFARRMAWCRE